MKAKKVFKIIGIILLVVIIIITCIVGYFYYTYTQAFNTENKPYKNYIGYINQEKALLNDVYTLCENGYILRTYNGAGLDAYTVNKKHYRDQLNTTFNHNEFTDSGYLNFRFLVNCKGQAGWFEIIEMNLDLEEQPLDPKLVDALLSFTSKSEHWNVLNYSDSDKAYNYYMYVSYRIEYGKVTEIIP